MSQSPSTERPVALSESARLRWRGMLHTATLRVAGSAIVHAPTLDDCAAVLERAREDLEDLEDTVELFRELTGRDLAVELSGAGASMPSPESWLEVTVAQLVLCVAAQMEAHSSLGYLARKTEHVAAARSTLRDLWACSPGLLEPLPELLSRWVGVACSALDDSSRLRYFDALRRELHSAPVHVAG